MSAAEVKRLAADAMKDEKLASGLRELKDAISIAPLVSFGTKHGYDFTEADVKAYLVEQAGALSEEQLDGVTGGTLTGGVAQIINSMYYSGGTLLEKVIKGAPLTPSKTFAIASGR